MFSCLNLKPLNISLMRNPVPMEVIEELDKLHDNSETAVMRGKQRM